MFNLGGGGAEEAAQIQANAIRQGMVMQAIQSEIARGDVQGTVQPAINDITSAIQKAERKIELGQKLANKAMQLQGNQAIAQIEQDTGQSIDTLKQSGAAAQGLAQAGTGQARGSPFSCTPSGP